MTQDEQWNKMYEEIMLFISRNLRRPSKHRIEEHRWVNWMKHNKKALNTGKMDTRRRERFLLLLATCENVRRKNQYAYKHTTLPLFPDA